MRGDRFYCTLRYPVTFPLQGMALLEDIVRYVVEQRPSLAGRHDVNIYLDQVTLTDLGGTLTVGSRRHKD